MLRSRIRNIFDTRRSLAGSLLAQNVTANSAQTDKPAPTQPDENVIVSEMGRRDAEFILKVESVIKRPHLRRKPRCGPDCRRCLHEPINTLPQSQGHHRPIHCGTHSQTACSRSRRPPRKRPLHRIGNRIYGRYEQSRQLPPMFPRRVWHNAI